MKVPEGILVVGRMVAGFLIVATVAVAALSALSYRAGQVIAVHLFLVGLTVLGVFVLVVVGTATAEWLRRTDNLGAFVAELGLSIVGSTATLYFVFWLVIARQPISNHRLLYVIFP